MANDYGTLRVFSRDAKQGTDGYAPSPWLVHGALIMTQVFFGGGAGGFLSLAIGGGAPGPAGAEATAGTRETERTAKPNSPSQASRGQVWRRRVRPGHLCPHPGGRGRAPPVPRSDRCVSVPLFFPPSCRRPAT